jgi:hypothetical protein
MGFPVEHSYQFHGCGERQRGAREGLRTEPTKGLRKFLSVHGTRCRGRVIERGLQGASDPL